MPKSFNKLPLEEQLYVKQALYSRLAGDVSTKDPDSLRGQFDAALVETYANTGYKSKDAMIDGQKVGTYSVHVGKGKPQEVVSELRVTDHGRLIDYVLYSDECADERKEYLELMAKNFAEFCVHTYGTVCDGCEMVERVIPEQPPKVLGTTLRIDAEKVGKALGGYLPTSIAGMLEGSGR